MLFFRAVAHGCAWLRLVALGRAKREKRRFSADGAHFCMFGGDSAYAARPEDVRLRASGANPTGDINCHLVCFCDLFHAFPLESETWLVGFEPVTWRFQ